MFTVLLFKFSKKDSSTKIPASSDAVPFTNCLAVEPMDIINPIVKFRIDENVRITEYNYAYITAFNRYYRIKTWRTQKGFWYAEMVVDALASWKDDIGSSTQFISRCSAYVNPRLNDNIYPLLSGCDVQTTYHDFTGWSYSPQSGTYVVGIIGTSGGGIGAVDYYLFSPENIRGLNIALLSNPTWLGNIPEISNELLKALFNPMQYITSCVWIPYSLADDAGFTTIPFGWNWNLSLKCYRVQDSRTLYNTYADIPVQKNPYSGNSSIYLRGVPYTSYHLQVPPFGGFELDADKLIDSNSIHIEVTIDITNGSGRLVVSAKQPNNAYYTFVDVVAQVGIPIQLSQSSIDKTAGVGLYNVQTAAIVANEVSDYQLKLPGESLPIIGAIPEYVNRAIEKTSDFLQLNKAAGYIAQKAVEPLAKYGGTTVYSSGANGTFCALGSIRITSVFQHQSERMPTILGYPAQVLKKISTIPGYIKCGKVELSIPCTAQELEMITFDMTNGFHYE